jgi:ribonuclease Z
VQPLDAGNSLPLTLYGPTGLKEFVETALRLSGSGPIIRSPLSKWALVWSLMKRAIGSARIRSIIRLNATAIVSKSMTPGTLDAARLIADGVSRARCFSA